MQRSLVVSMLMGASCLPGDGDVTATASTGTTTSETGTTTSGSTSASTTSTSETGPETTSEPTTSTTTTTGPNTTTTTTTGPSTTTTTTTTTTSTSTSTTGPEPDDFKPLSLEIGDFDGDGRLDHLIFGVNGDTATVGRLSLGLGDGTFDEPLPLEVVGTSAYPIVGDVDLDDRTDYAISVPSKSLQILLSDGVGGFVEGQQLTGIAGLRSSVIVDSDDDGDNDVVSLFVDNDDKFGLRTFASEGGAFFWDGVTTFIGDVDIVGINPGGLLVGDLDGDGLGDALLWQPNTQDALIRVFGTLGGTFISPKKLFGVRIWTAELADADGDGDLDLIAVDRSQSAIVVLLNDGAGVLEPGPITAVDALLPFEMTIADMDQDGDIDVVLVDEKEPMLGIWYNDGAGYFPESSLHDLPSPSIRVHAGLVDGGEAVDLIAATFKDTAPVAVVLNH